MPSRSPSSLLLLLLSVLAATHLAPPSAHNVALARPAAAAAADLARPVTSASSFEQEQQQRKRDEREEQWEPRDDLHLARLWKRGDAYESLHSAANAIVTRRAAGENGNTTDSAAAADTVEVVTRSQGTFVGNKRQDVGQDQFFGIPYAKPPTGALRFSASQPPDAVPHSTRRDALSPGKACFQASGQGADPSSFSEDCLFLNVYRPSGAAQRGGRLPVMVWIHGGSWSAGSSTLQSYDATKLVARSVQVGEPIVFVSLNYRLGIFGFLGGKQIDELDARGQAKLNAGYWDQRLALRWVKENIGAFGGDPDKVTLFGASAGANSVAAQMLANGGQHEGLFRAAIFQSGNQNTAGRVAPDVGIPAAVFANLLQLTGCKDVACLRGVAPAALAGANEQLIRGGAVFSPTRDRFFVQELPSAQFAAGRFPRIPIITGDNLDEGTLFADTDTYRNFASDEAIIGALRGLLPYASNATLAELLRLYPDVPAKGSPYKPELVGTSPDNRFFGPTSNYKRVSSILGDLLFEYGRRQQLLATSTAGVPCWSYQFQQPSADLTKPQLAVVHGSEVGFVFNQPGLAPPPLTFREGSLDAALARYASSDAVQTTAERMSTFWISFASHLDPNALLFKSPKGTAPMPRYDAISRLIMRFAEEGKTEWARDDYRPQQIDFLLANAASLGG